jgi:hypothetical protein
MSEYPTDEPRVNPPIDLLVKRLNHGALHGVLLLPASPRGFEWAHMIGLNPYPEQSIIYRPWEARVLIGLALEEELIVSDPALEAHVLRKDLLYGTEES